MEVEEKKELQFIDSNHISSLLSKVTKISLPDQKVINGMNKMQQQQFIMRGSKISMNCLSNIKKILENVNKGDAADGSNYEIILEEVSYYTSINIFIYT